MWRRAVIAVAVVAVPTVGGPLALGGEPSGPRSDAVAQGRSTEGLVAIATVDVKPADAGCRPRIVSDLLGAAALVGPQVPADVPRDGVCGDQPPNRR